MDSLLLHVWPIGLNTEVFYCGFLAMFLQIVANLAGNLLLPVRPIGLTSEVFLLRFPYHAFAGCCKIGWKPAFLWCVQSLKFLFITFRDGKW